MPTATMTSKGQITLPAETRRKLRLVAGTKIDFVTNEAGETVIRPKTGNIMDLHGIVKRDGPPLSLEDIDRVIGEAVMESYQRSIE